MTLQDMIRSTTAKSLFRASWSKVRIGDIADIIGGGTPSTKDAQNFDGNIPWLTPKDLSGIHDRYVSGGKRNLSRQGLAKSSARLLPTKSVLLTTRAPIGYVAIAKNPVATNQGFRSLVTRNGVIPEYLYYWLKQNTDELKRYASGSTFGELSGSSLGGIQLELPHPKEQRAIARVLGTLDDKIELNRRMNKTLEAMAQAFFKDWFVDFGPVRAKIEGRKPYLTAEIWNLFPDALGSEGTPAGWTKKSLDEIASFLNGLALQKFPAANEHDSLPVIKIAEIRNGITAKSSRASRKVPAKYVVKDGDFLFSWSGSLLAKFWTGGEGALNQHLFKVTSDRYPAWFFSNWVCHHLGNFQDIAATKATTMGHIKREHLTQAVAICPPDDVLASLGETLRAATVRIVKNELQNRTLTHIRNLLLPKLIGGEIRVTDAEPDTGQSN